MHPKMDFDQKTSGLNYKLVNYSSLFQTRSTLWAHINWRTINIKNSYKFLNIGLRLEQLIKILTRNFRKNIHVIKFYLATTIKTSWKNHSWGCWGVIDDLKIGCLTKNFWTEIKIGQLINSISNKVNSLSTH